MNKLGVYSLFTNMTILDNNCGEVSCLHVSYGQNKHRQSSVCKSSTVPIVRFETETTFTANSK